MFYIFRYLGVTLIYRYDSDTNSTLVAERCVKSNCQYIMKYTIISDFKQDTMLLNYEAAITLSNGEWCGVWVGSGKPCLYPGNPSYFLIVLCDLDAFQAVSAGWKGRYPI